MDCNSPSTSRKFVDLILKASDRWANWNPTHDIKVGDYGKLDERTGQFYKEGNIYDDTHIYADENIATLVKNNLPTLAPREDVYIAASSKVKRGDLNFAAETQIPGLADASIRGQWIFGRSRGALLIMAHPRSSYIPPAILLKHLAEVQALKDMFLITEVFSCPAYMFYLSNRNSEAVDLALVGSLPGSDTPGMTVTGEIQGRWWSQNTSGLFRSARHPNGKYEYTPLYMLKRILQKRSFFSRRGEKRSEREGDDLWGDVQVPWNSLDEDGNEEEFEDTIFD